EAFAATPGYYDRRMAFRIAVLSVYFTLFDAQMPPDFRARQQAWVERLKNDLGSAFEVVAFSGLVTSEEEGAAAGRALREADPEVVVFVPPMAAPPSYAAAALASVDAPVVLWHAP